MTALSTHSATLSFRRPERPLGLIDADVAAKVVAAASDIAFVVDRAGIVRDLSISNADLAGAGFQTWLDRPWLEVVSGESRQKAADLLRDAAGGAPSRWREVNHPGEDGASVLIRYFALGSGEDGQVIVVGRDLRSTTALQQRLLQVQQSVERDYLRLRQAESRYRLLFQQASEAVLIVDAASRRVREANPAALRLTELTDAVVDGRAAAALFDPTSAEAAMQLLNSVQAGVSPPPLRVRLANGAECDLTASMFRQEDSARLLLRLAPHGAAIAPGEAGGKLNAVLERMPDGFVVTDPELKILTVNAAFLDLTQIASREQALDQALDRFLGRPHVDLKIMLSQLKEHGALRNFSTVMRGRYGGSEEVEVSAVAVLDAEPPCYGFSIRSVARRLQTHAIVAGEQPRSVEQLTQLIGRVPMKDIVRESTDLIERLCIEAALTLTSNNRASAADMLGLSRQSLYSKLHRYGLGSYDETAN